MPVPASVRRTSLPTSNPDSTTYPWGACQTTGAPGRKARSAPGGCPQREPPAGRVRPTGMRAGKPAARYIVIVLLCAAATACGSVRASAEAPTRAAGHALAGADSAAVRLVIEVTRHPGAKPQRWTLRCHPVGGTHPDAGAACRVLEHAKNPFAPIRPDMMCPASPASRTATIRGIWSGHPVNATYTQNGCGLLRWHRIWQVFR